MDEIRKQRELASFGDMADADSTVRHARLMEAIEMATGGVPAGEGNAQESDDDDPDWDDEEDIFGFEQNEGELYGNSLGVFSSQNRVRTFCAHLVRNEIFDLVMVVSILVIMFTLAYDSPSKQLSARDRQLIDAFDVYVCILFTVEAAARIIAQGFVIGEKAYLRNGWNVLALIIVGSMWVAFMISSWVKQSQATDDYVAVLRSISLIRPLHLLRYVNGVKTILAALTFSAGFLATVTMLMALFMVIFSSFGIELWHGTVSRTCDINHFTAGLELEPLTDPRQCPVTLPCEHLWSTTDMPAPLDPGVRCYEVPSSYVLTGDWMDASGCFGFDNMAQAMLTLYIMTSMDEWPLIERRLQLSQCSTCAGLLWPMMLIMVILLAFLGANMFVAVLTYSYEKVMARQHQARIKLVETAKTQDGPSCNPIMEGAGQSAVTIHQLLSQHGFEPKHGVEDHEQGMAGAPDGKQNTNEMANLDVVANWLRADGSHPWPYVGGLSERCRTIALSKLFENFISVVIVVNAVVMAAHQYPGSELVIFIQEVTDYMFVVIYTTEIVIKVFGLGFRPFLAVPFHGMDLMIVCLSLYSLYNPNAKGAQSSRMVRLCLRIVRLLRLLKVVGQVDSVMYLLKALTSSSAKLLNMTGLIAFFIVLLSTVTMHMLGDCEGSGHEISARTRTNFYTFGDSLLANIQLLTGEDWAPVMFVYMEECGWGAAPLLCGIVLFYAFVLMNLFTAIILQNFAISEHDKMRHQRRAYDASKGVEAKEEEMRILEWLAEAAEGDAVASKTIQASITAINSTQSVIRDFMMKICPCFVIPESKVEAQENALIKVEGELVSLIAEAAGVETQIRELEFAKDQLPQELNKKKISDIDSENIVLKQQRDELQKQIQALHIRVADERDALQESKGSPEEENVDYACCCISNKTAVRRAFKVVVDNSVFQFGIIVAIILSSYCLSFRPDAEPEWAKVLSDICSLIFVAEFLLKVIAWNALNYFRVGWNFLDFFIVVTAVIEWIYPVLFSSHTDDLSSLKILRILRLLRVLRAIRQVKQLRLIITVLVGCLPTVFAAIAIVLIIYTCFGILGLYMFSGKFYQCHCVEGAENCDETLAMQMCSRYFYGVDSFQDDNGDPLMYRDTYIDPCSQEPRPWAQQLDESFGAAAINASWGSDNAGLTRVVLDICCDDPVSKLCLDTVTTQVDQLSNGMLEWANPAYNFDSIQNAVQAMFYMSTTEGWVSIMHAGMDTPIQPGLPPVYQRNWYLSMYFVAFQVIGAGFCMALFTGVLVNYFAESSGSGTLTRKQKEWVNAKLLVLRAHSVNVDEPPAGIKKAAHRLYTWKFFEAISSGFILLQVLVILQVRFPHTGLASAGIDSSVSFLCLIFFTFEMVLGCLALGTTAYLKSTWNKFDVLIVALSWGAFVLEHSSDQFEGLDVQIQALRATRVVRVLALFKGSSNLQAIFAALVLSFPAVINITILMLVIFFVFSVLGMHAYSEMPFGEHINRDQNFGDCWSGMKLLFEVATGHDFLHIIHEIRNNAEDKEINADGNLSSSSFGYFFVFYLAAVLVMANLFVAMLLENIHVSLAAENSLIKAVHCDLFKSAWNEMVKQGRGKVNKTGAMRLNCYDVIELVEGMDEPLGRVVELDVWKHRLLLELGVPLTINRRQTYVSFSNALMAVCVLYLSNSCLPYALQHRRTLDVLYQQQETATRLIQCRCTQWIRSRRIKQGKFPEYIEGVDGDKVMLDTAQRKWQYQVGVKIAANWAFYSIVMCNKISIFSLKKIKARGKKAGEARVRFEWNSAQKQLVATVFEVRGLRKMDVFGKNDVYVIVSCNKVTLRTGVVREGGTECEFSEDLQNRMVFDDVDEFHTMVIRAFDECVSLSLSFYLPPPHPPCFRF